MVDQSDKHLNDNCGSASVTDVATTTAGNQEDGDMVEAAREVAGNETMHVRLWRFIVMDFIIMIGCTIALTSYALLRDAEKYNFEDSFEKFSYTLANAAIEGQTLNRDALMGLASIISSSANLANSTWPFFTLPNFETYAQQVKHFTSIQTLAFAPLVTNEQASSWIEFANKSFGAPLSVEYGYHPFITKWGPSQERFVRDNEREYYFPLVAHSPVLDSYEDLNWNVASPPEFQTTMNALMELQNETLMTSLEGFGFTHMMSPIHQDPAPRQSMDSPLVGVVLGGFSWKSVLNNIVPNDVNGIVVVVQESNMNISKNYTYEINGPIAEFKGETDMHDPYYDDYKVEVDLSSHLQSWDSNVTGHCQFQMSFYPSRTLVLEHRTPFPEIASVVLGMAFLIVSCVFFKYDTLVDRRNEKLIDKFARSNAIVSSLFPKEYRDRLMEDKDTIIGRGNKDDGNLKNLMKSGVCKNDANSKPLADIFPFVSIMFADIAGFTAWSSVREPHQVFTLLETLFGSFDESAKTYNIFKVETVGDCYVAASGLPNPRRDHAIAIVKFAISVLQRMQVLTKELEVMLGPDTGDLSLRVGIHSGPVTAGILRGQKARFQLFGDTMNMASRVESNGMPGRIQVSQATADCLIESGCGHWLQKRPEKIVAKGKGLIQTYWITASAEARGTENTSVCSKSLVEDVTFDNHLPNNGANIQEMSTQFHTRSSSLDHLRTSGREERNKRLIEWNVETLLRLLKQIAAHRKAQGDHMVQEHVGGENTMNAGKTHKLPLDEVKEIISLPEFNRNASYKQYLDQVEIDSSIIRQLRSFVTAIALRYNDNAFHNFEHASHVAQSVNKLLSRIVAPLDSINDFDQSYEGGELTLHDHTYGITSDPLTQFSCAFSAIIHDLDHSGVPNAQLVKEKCEFASQYRNRSVAEQHSFDISWDLFMHSSYDELRSAICATPSELQRFRQLVVNAVMATDIADRELKELRNARWEKAFAAPNKQEDSTRDAVNRKATIVIEHLIQASDVAHTMQHWHVYRKWNERLFCECYKAYLDGRAEKDPTEMWYRGEIGFFDFYILPLAKKLKDCGVFGVSSDEYLNYAINNREEWEIRGQEIVAKLAESMKKEREMLVSMEIGD